MITIHKYFINDDGIILLYDGYQILSVGTQNGRIYIWVKVDTKASLCKVQLRVYGTGWDLSELPLDATFIGTVFHDLFVYHIWFTRV